PDTKGMIAALSADSLISVGEGLRNVLEPVAELEEVARIEKLMNQKGAVGACMSGSGPTVFGIFDDITVAKACVQALGREYREVYLTEPSCHGCEILEN
ncbi:MAG TPA: 4-(cytidine 5'-diphospho)-2-C-methyl-D-erythritol kinase, partial [Clostridia bacterium]|nr:4-(cytidine 5'-diphospho)-2-C-methyl-D-erythritol kinase [Clostridia bacterium]